MTLRSVALLLLLSTPLAAQSLQYPGTATVDHTDNYHGTVVADPYRWLEDDTASATRAWVTAENEVTFGYLARIPYRAQLRQRLEELFNYPKIGAPFREGSYFLFFKNEGLQNQSVLYIQRGLEGTPEVLIDPNALSTDGTTRLGALALSQDTRYTGYGLSQGGSDWQEYRVLETATKKVLEDRIRWVKVSSLAWRGAGFYYSRYPTPADTTKALSGKNENHQVWYHRVGTPQSQDELVFEDAANPQRFHTVQVTDDERFLILYVSDRGKGKDGNAIYVKNLARGDKEFRPVITSFDDDFNVLDNIGDKLLVETNKGAPNRRVILIDPVQPAEASWKAVVPEKPEPLKSVSSAGGRLFVTYLKDVSDRTYVLDQTGKVLHEIKLPGLGQVGGFGGRKEEKFVFYTYSSFTYPPTVFKYDIATRTSTVFRRTTVRFDPEQYETEQVFYRSKDGTRVPMFLVHQKGLKADGQRPTLLYGYGGFNIALGPSFNPLLVSLLEQGGVYAVANLRGGSEYGEEWHKAGMKANKQNVFDDFIAAAEWLQSNGWTSKDRCALQGGSNGGLLVGAVINQRPELCKVALPAVGVMDMLRFHKFTIGWNWIADYGSSDDPEGFKYLSAYSPYHNLKAGTAYPATLITTADHDDRVVPAHSFKYAARLQVTNAGPNPTLIRIETKSGHGAVSTSKRLDETADVYGFMWYNLEMEPRFAATP